MKYDILLPFRDYLNENVKNKNTADRYYQAVNGMLKDLQFNSLTEISCAELENRLKRFKRKNDFSAAKNGLLWLKKYDRGLELPAEQFFRKTSKSKRNYAVKPKQPIYLDTVRRKINGIRDPKLKLGYRLMMVSGLRVSEAAALQKKDIEISGDIVTVNVLHGKGGSNGKVVSQSDPYLAKKLAEYLLDKEEADILFYAAETMIKKAGELDLECHDLRRIAAITLRDQKISEGMDRETANLEVQQFLRHSRFSTTKRYLYGKKLIRSPKTEEK